MSLRHLHQTVAEALAVTRIALRERLPNFAHALLDHVLIAVAEDDAKLVAAEAGENVLLADELLCALDKAAYIDVALGVTVAVVDVFQVVEVAVGDADAGLGEGAADAGEEERCEKKRAERQERTFPGSVFRSGPGTVLGG